MQYPDRSPESPYSVSMAQQQRYENDGFIIIRQLFKPTDVSNLYPIVMDEIQRSGRLDIALDQREDAYSRAFVQLVNIGRNNPDISQITKSPRLGSTMCGLLNTRGTRLWLEDTFLKPPGAGITPWHQDGSVSPVDPSKVLTAWIPLHPIQPNMGGLRLVAGSHTRLWGPVDISEQTQQTFNQLISAHQLTIYDLPEMFPGDVLFHNGCTIHGAFANQSNTDRLAIAVHCFAFGERIIDIHHPNQERLLRELAPSCRSGDIADSPAWPLLYLSTEHRA